MSERLLPTELLPESLWISGNNLLHLSPEIKKAYCEMIQDLGLSDLALSRGNGGGPIGGLTKQETELHFAQAVDGSIARVQLAVLDPKDEIKDVSDAFISQLSGGELLITDAPCGCGAGTYSFLSTIIELRKLEIIPRIPLDITIIGAEISESARNMAIEMLNRLMPALNEQAITVNSDFYHWDVTDVYSNVQLIKKINIAFTKTKKRLLIIANFSGFLKTKSQEASQQLYELLRHYSDDNSMGIWIEPQWNPATAKGGWFQKLTTAINLMFLKFIKSKSVDENGSSHVQTSAKFELPFDPPNQGRINLAVVTLEFQS